MDSDDYVIRTHASLSEIDAQAWDALLFRQTEPSPFMRHAYLAALHDSGSASTATGWTATVFALELDGSLQAACVAYEKDHSYGEYVFDWSWANAHQQHGLPYYPKAVVAVPFTPVPGSRILAVDDKAREALLSHLLAWCNARGLSSLHVLFGAKTDTDACAQSGLMLRHTVQFHWHNAQDRYQDFDHFLAQLSQDKRKKIRQERRKVADAGVTFRHAEGQAISDADWDFFYRCYERTYLEHGNAPYLNRAFFQQLAHTMPEQWVLFIAERNGRAIASSLIAVSAYSTGATGQNGINLDNIAYGRYWGALERVDCLHFEACYYQPLQWCIAKGYARFEGGAQGEHKMARALMPVKTSSAHWLAHPSFADAVSRFLEREGEGIGEYLSSLDQRSPLRS